MFRQHGYTGEAEEILIAQRRQAHRARGGRRVSLRRALDGVYGVSVGYGYRPGRVLWLLAALLILVGISLEIPAGQATLRTRIRVAGRIAELVLVGGALPPGLAAWRERALAAGVVTEHGF